MRSPGLCARHYSADLHLGRRYHCGQKASETTRQPKKGGPVMSMSGDCPNIDPKGRYNESDAARCLGINRSTLWRWRKQGRIRPKHERLTRRPKYSGADLLALFYS